ncbi:MAG: asparagine synthase (glutamine-hydrolyzing) [Bacteroidia bacterium]
MCGINGISGLQGTIASEKVTAMNRAMKHRGPDDTGIFAAENIALGHQRLSIIDLSSAGHQPMSSYDGRYSIVYNGELYNFKELKFELQRVISGSGEQAYFFQTQTDTEVIIAAYARWGAKCLDRFNGMFAFAIWDNEKKELFIARDRLGVKPLYYFYSEGLLIFSSEVRSLLASGLIPRKIDENGLIDYLRYQTVHAPDTIVKGVKMLLPGHYILSSKDKVMVHRYWDLEKNVSKVPLGKSYKEVCSDISQLLTKAVERRLIADVPFGAFLSGGIDSSAVVGLMSKVSTEKVRTFSVVFDEGEFSEAKYARIIAKKFNTDHHEIRLTPQDFIKEWPDALKAMDHPSGDGVNTYVVSKATRNAGITMALSGLGGDEIFAGYSVFSHAMRLEKKKWLNMFPGFVRGIGGSALQMIRPGVSSDKIAALMKQDRVDFTSFYSLSRQVLMDDRLCRITGKESLPPGKVRAIIEAKGSLGKGHLLSDVSIAEMSTYMQNVLLRDADQMSMAHALEVRVPLIDYTLVEYVLGVEDKYKSLTSPKKLLTDSLGDLLPPEIINRPKMGFTLPWKLWIKSELKEFCAQKLSDLSARGTFDKKEIMKLWNDFLRDDPRVSWSRVWYLVVLENWLSEHGIS